jgi:hypothetical protein
MEARNASETLVTTYRSTLNNNYYGYHDDDDNL